MLKPKLPALPVLDCIDALREALAAGGSAVLAAAPGSGKTTVVPLTLLDAPWLAGRSIVMLEPRRVAARTAAARMAFLLGEAVGETVGYQIRFERRISARTRIEVVTEGLLTRRLQSEPELPGVGLVIFDEFHERSLDADLALALCLDARLHLNPSLRVLLMSATLDTQRVARLLDEAPVIETAGRLYPIDIRYRSPAADPAHGEQVARAALRALDETAGDLLAFLPGARDIRLAQSIVDARGDPGLVVRPLYGELSSEQQDLALRPDAGGRRKLILATNIAQTSLTVEGVNTVVDGGLQRFARFDLSAGADRLDTQRVSRAAAEQRAGRAGRLGPGICYRLWSRDQHASLAPHDAPQISAVDLSRFALELAAWGVTAPASLALLDQPPASHWSYAVERLREIGALAADGRITARGRALMRLPVRPRLAHMLLTARQAGIGGIAAWTAAALETRTVPGQGDLATAVQQFIAGSGEPAQRRQVAESARNFLRIAGIAGDAPIRASDADIARCIAWAYPERIAWRRHEPRGAQQTAFLCADGIEARLHEGDALATSPWLAIAHWDPGPPRRVRSAVSLAADDVYRDQKEHLLWQRSVHWNAQDGAVIAEQQLRLGAIVLERKPLPPGEATEAVAAAMLEGIAAIGVHALPWTEAARQLQARVETLRQWRTDEAWPDFSDAGLMAGIDFWLAPHLSGVTRRAHLQRLDLAAILGGQLGYEQQQALRELAPTHVEVPTGSRIRIDYQPPGPPTLSVKLQEMFGCSETPSVNGGRTRLVLHLLSPAQRPIAVTQDLGGFWAGSYAEVRRDLRGRYPRHPWPEDPLNAVPTRRAKPRSQ